MQKSGQKGSKNSMISGGFVPEVSSRDSGDKFFVRDPHFVHMGDPHFCVGACLVCAGW